MSKNNPKNLSVSILQRLKNYSKENDEDFGLTLSRFAIERFIYRLSVSKYANQFVLKGAQLFRIWADTPIRPTRDLDLLRFGSADISELVDIFKHICDMSIEESDGIQFLPDTVKAEAIRDQTEYDGIRVRLEYRIGKTGQYVQVDIGFGDAITPSSREIEYPSILDMSQPRMQSYPCETVIAEKIEAMVSLGITNSRMKDFFDIYILSEKYEFKGNIVQKAIEQTFRRRQTDIPDGLPIALTEDFYKDTIKQAQWLGFLRRHELNEVLEGRDFEEVVNYIKEFIIPIFDNINSRSEIELKWIPQEGWLKR